METSDTMLTSLCRAIASHDINRVSRLLNKSPALARESAEAGASREKAVPYYLNQINHYVYVGDTALHIAAAAYRLKIVEDLLALGAQVRARNRLGAEPLHYAADGVPGSSHWNPRDQAATIVCLIRAGAEPNCSDKRGVTPLHRAVRTRCGAAVRALLEHGADPRQTNGNGSTPLTLATLNTGRGGSGSAAARAEQAQIVEMLSTKGTITL